MSAVLVALLACTIAGAVFDRALFHVPGAGLIERFGRALLFGLGLAGVLSMALDAAAVPISRLSLGGALLVLVVLLLRPALRRREAMAGAAPARDPTAPRWMIVGLMALALVGPGQALFAGWVRPAFQFDSVTRWLFKAKALAHEHTLRGPISTDPDFAFTHQRYPPLVSHVANLPALINGRFDDRLAGAMFPWYMVALVGVAYGALARRAGRLRAAIGAAWIGNLPLLAYVMYPPPGAGAASAMADVPLSLFLTGATLALMDGIDGWRDRAHLEAALLLGFAALTKNEGLPAVAGGALALVLCARRARWRTALGVAGLALLVYWALWGRIAAGLPALDEHYPARLHAAAVAEGLPRLPRILGQLLLQAVDFRSWNLTWLAIPALLVIGRRTRGVVAAVIVASLQLASYVFALVITAWTSPAGESSGADPVDYLMILTLGRLLVHVAPLLVAAALVACPPLLGRAEDAPAAPPAR